MLAPFAPGHVGIITGAASGIGLATALRLAGMGMKLVLVDINEDKLAKAEEAVAAAAGDHGANVLPVILSVDDPDGFSALAHDVEARWEAPTFLMNNAAMFVHGGAGGILDSLQTWRRIFDINLFGIIHGVQAFLPGMLASGKRSMIVNTGSKQGLTNPPGNPAYNSVKAAVNSYTQNLAHDLRNREEGLVSAHLLVPGWTTTGDQSPQPGAWSADQVADYMLTHLAHEDFYIICPDNETSSEMDKKRVLWQALDLIENRPALSRWHPDHKDAFAQFMVKDLADLLPRK
ncbi:MAG: SDR family NAD(P)-dependent oxidoreductase [Hyphomicrobiaceae bacterium]|nr:SDR family NAD(P)-dependent oxidoreductase [Hyphomicrobiaceae bacterium]MCC0023759.1 SDR family NAD(P)-dependent oxidoreductase [Hyphomicrobiaceae bacterium]